MKMLSIGIRNVRANFYERLWISITFWDGIGSRISQYNNVSHAVRERSAMTRTYKQVRNKIVFGLISIGLLVFAIWWGM